MYAQFYQLRAVAERLKQQLAAHDRRRALTPKQAGYPAPFLTPTQQQQFRDEARAREREKQRLLEEVNRSMKAAYLPDYLRASPLLNQPKGAKNAVPGTLVVPQPRPGAVRVLTNGSDCFMPVSFWKSQNPTGSTKVGWKLCCDTVKTMVGYNAGEKDRIQIVKEHGRQLRLQPTAARGFQKLDEYLALHKPVMTGVDHTFAAGYNEGTTDHFVAIVGTGVDTKGKYYRFFDVGTTAAKWKNGTDPKNRLYYDAHTGSYSGKSVVNGRTYTISQLRFKPGTF